MQRGAGLNSERVVLCGPGVTLADGNQVSGAFGAAAVAGVLAAERDPALPLHGVVLKGLQGVVCRWSEAEIDSLVQGGVTPLEAVGGEVTVIRGVSSRTTTAGAADTTWRELSTIRIVDDVIPAVRTTLRTQFARTKNTAQTRSAVRSAVIVVLENKKSSQIIEQYGQVTVTADALDPTTCVVEFYFTVAHGLNRIYLTAHITV